MSCEYCVDIIKYNKCLNCFKENCIKEDCKSFKAYGKKTKAQTDKGDYCKMCGQFLEENNPLDIEYFRQLPYKEAEAILPR